MHIREYLAVTGHLERIIDEKKTPDNSLYKEGSFQIDSLSSRDLSTKQIC